MKRKIWFGVLAGVLLLMAVGAVLARPYMAPPAESREALEARYAEFRRVADEVQNRPKQDIEAMVTLVGELEPVLGKETVKEKAMMGVEFGSKVSCPSVNLDDVRKSAADIQEVTARDERWRAIVADGFVPQQDVTVDADLPNFSWVRRYMFAQLAAAILEVDQGKADAAVDRIVMIQQTDQGLMTTPVLIYLMVGVAIADRTDDIIIYLIPRLGDRDLTVLRDSVAKRTDVLPKMLDAMAVEIVWAADTWGDRKSMETGFKTAIPAFGWLWPVVQYTGVVKHARWNYLSFATRMYDYFAQWVRNPTAETPDLPQPMIDELKTNVAAAIGVPNYNRLLDKARLADVHRQAVLAAIDAELARRKSGVAGKIELPYDPTRRIVIDGDYGCVVDAK